MRRTPAVLGIAGSPRRFGNSDRLLEAALAGAREAGAETRTLVAAEAGIRHCLGCNACSIDGECIQHDGGPALYQAIDAADAIIVATPVYFAGVPGVLKALIDRMQPYWARTYVLRRPRPARRPGAILIARGGGDPYGFEHAEASVRSAFAVLDIDVLDVLVAAEVDRPADLEAHPEVLARARTLGAAVAEEASRRLRAR